MWVCRTTHAPRCAVSQFRWRNSSFLLSVVFFLLSVVLCVLCVLCVDCVRVRVRVLCVVRVRVLCVCACVVCVCTHVCVCVVCARWERQVNLAADSPERRPVDRDGQMFQLLLRKRELGVGLLRN